MIYETTRFIRPLIWFLIFDFWFLIFDFWFLIFAELSEKERKRRFAFLIAEKRLTAERQYYAQLSESGELDSDSNLDEETDSEDSFPDQKENSSKPFDSREFTLGLIIGIFIGLCFGFVFPNQHTYLLAPHK